MCVFIFSFPCGYLELEVAGPFYSLFTRNYATDFNMNFLEVSLLLYKEKLFTFGVH